MWTGQVMKLSVRSTRMKVNTYAWKKMHFDYRWNAQGVRKILASRHYPRWRSLQKHFLYVLCLTLTVLIDRNVQMFYNWLQSKRRRFADSFNFTTIYVARLIVAPFRVKSQTQRNVPFWIVFLPASSKRGMFAWQSYDLLSLDSFLSFPCSKPFFDSVSSWISRNDDDEEEEEALLQICVFLSLKGRRWSGVVDTKWGNEIAETAVSSFPEIDLMHVVNMYSSVICLSFDWTEQDEWADEDHRLDVLL